MPIGSVELAVADAREDMLEGVARLWDGFDACRPREK